MIFSPTRTSIGIFSSPSFNCGSISTSTPVSKSPDDSTVQRITDLEEMVKLLKEQIAAMANDAQQTSVAGIGTMLYTFFCEMFIGLEMLMYYD